MDNRLNYHTSTNITTESKGGVVGEPWFPYYHTSLQSSRIALENLNRFNKKLDENNVLTNAFLAQNPFISDEEREIFNKQMKQKALEELYLYESTLEKWRKRKEQNEKGGFQSQ
jgi:hypothetical protein